ncbi:phosphatidylglycerophosphatase A [Roseobacter sp. HKCCA0434]|uniref:phosphatidylglycerophosphatase A family protein n=1 Tax=Roseobacter sp. HKCCA0434 TaxID=3079297 RepID=UPI002905AE9D|nr:phosphatidylglycerophosphatase A [Roseobacter sp. HKCCA0434]
MMARAIATFGFVGLLPKAPGTWGSLAALPVFWVLHGLGQFPLVLLATAVAFGAGYWATARIEAREAAHDPGWIVIDEVVGQWIAMYPLSFGLWWMGADPWSFAWPGFVLGFALFRLFDIWKPGPVGWADRTGGALGVMLDDVFAGIMAGICVGVLGALAHLVVM